MIREDIDHLISDMLKLRQYAIDIEKDYEKRTGLFVVKCPHCHNDTHFILSGVDYLETCDAMEKYNLEDTLKEEWNGGLLVAQNIK